MACHGLQLDEFEVWPTFQHCPTMGSSQIFDFVLLTVTFPSGGASLCHEISPSPSAGGAELGAPCRSTITSQQLEICCQDIYKMPFYCATSATEFSEK